MELAVVSRLARSGCTAAVAVVGAECGGGLGWFVRYRVHFVHLLCNAPFDTTHVPSLQDPALLSPGQLELEAHPNTYQGSLGPRKKVRDVNMHVPWEGLALVLEQLAGVLAAAARLHTTSAVPAARP